MKKLNFDTKGVLIDQKLRKAGSMTDEDGKPVEWGEAEQVILLPFGNAKGDIRKFCIASGFEDHVLTKLNDVNWGALIELTLDDRLVVDVEVLFDWVPLYNEEPEQ